MKAIPYTAPIACVVTLVDGEAVTLTGVTRVDRQRHFAEKDNRDGASAYSIFEPRATGTLTIHHDGGIYSVPLELVATITQSR